MSSEPPRTASSGFRSGYPVSDDNDRSETGSVSPFEMREARPQYEFPENQPTKFDETSGEKKARLLEIAIATAFVSPRLHTSIAETPSESLPQSFARLLEVTAQVGKETASVDAFYQTSVAQSILLWSYL